MGAVGLYPAELATAVAAKCGRAPALDEHGEAVRRESRKQRDYGDAVKYLVHFKVEKVRPLVGE